MTRRDVALKEFNQLTPVEEYDGILYKRDDKFMPFDDVPITGGKVRQCLSLLERNYDYIKDHCDSLVATATSVNSPQGIVVARSAREFGFNSLIVFGGTNARTLMQNPMVKWVHYCGSEFDLKCKLGYDGVLNSRIRDIKETRKLFHVKFGINLENDPDSIINSVAHQVQNLPEDIDNLIIPTGSAITAGGILCGLIKYPKIKPKRVIIVQISGYDRQDTLHRIFRAMSMDHMPVPEYEYVADKTYSYSRQLKIRLNTRGEYHDPVYEAKAYDWMIKNVNYKNEKTLFWIVGNSYYVRAFTPEMYQMAMLE